MVWLHGGAFSTGGLLDDRPTGDHFARDGVVLVSVNHRLNVFGFYAAAGKLGLRVCLLRSCRNARYRRGASLGAEEHRTLRR